MEHEATRQEPGRTRPQGDAAPRGPHRRAGWPERSAEDREAVFDITDFAAIAHFAGIAPVRRAG